MNLQEYKKSLNVRYTGMTEELAEKLELEAKKPKTDLDMDINNDGKVDDKDISLAGKVLARSKKIKKKGE